MKSGEIFLIGEILSHRIKAGDCVRVFGFVNVVDLSRRLCEIEHKDNTLKVDFALVDSSCLQIGHIVQLIGDIYLDHHGVCVFILSFFDAHLFSCRRNI